MRKKRYKPVWTDGLNYEEQHLVNWISCNMERVDIRYTFLPIRMLGDWFCQRKRFHYVHLIRGWKESAEAVHSEKSVHVPSHFRLESQIVPLAYHVAEQAFDLAAKEFFDLYPEAQTVSYGKLHSNGVYDTSFAMDYQTRLEYFGELLDKQIEALSVMDEVFAYSEVETTNYSAWQEYTVKAMLDIEEDDIYYGFPDFLKQHGFPYVPRQNVQVKKEDVYQYYTSIPENIFLLGNQHHKYNQNTLSLKPFFEAAANRNLPLIKEYISQGIEINAIDADGCTAFGCYLGCRKWDDPLSDTKCDIEGLKELLRMGASPAIYGVCADSCPIEYACLMRHFDAVELLLDNGVNPHLYPYLDEPYESETLLERTRRWAEEDPNIDGEPDDDHRRILGMLLKYA